MSKDFITYNKQMRHLRDKKQIDCNGTNDKIILCRTGYFNLVNGYKQPFVLGKNGNDHIYIGGTSIKQFHELKKFDDDLRMHLLRYITGVEEEIRALVGYKFDEINAQGKSPWYSVDSYDTNQETKDIVKVISDAYQQVHKSHQSYIQHYFQTHKLIPTWIMIKTINFSTFIEFLELCKVKIKDDICDLYEIVKSNGDRDYKLLIGSLHWMRKVRNSCAHNERIYGIQKTNNRISSDYFSMFPNSYKNERTQSLFDLFIYMKYYLPTNEYKKFITEIKKMLLELQSVLNTQSFNKVRADMGIKDISHLDILLTNNKLIEYNKF